MTCVLVIFYFLFALMDNRIYVKFYNAKGRLVPSQVRWRIVLPLPSLFEGILFHICYGYCSIRYGFHKFTSFTSTFYISRLFGIVVHKYISYIIVTYQERQELCLSYCRRVLRLTYFSLRIVKEKVKMFYMV